jgi:hypothetical protein
MELPIEDIQTILHITTNLDTLSALSLKLHTEIEAMRVLNDAEKPDPSKEPVVEIDDNGEEIREMELHEL